MTPRRDWKAAREKVDAEGRCRRCLSVLGLEAAHTIGRTHDRPHPTKKNTLWVNPDDIIPLCGPCHQAYDAHEIDLLPFMTRDEQVAAVRAVGGLELARKRLAPLSYSDGVAV